MTKTQIQVPEELFREVRAFRVTEFATAEVKDFDGLGFAKVWNPVAR